MFASSGRFRTSVRTFSAHARRCAKQCSRKHVQFPAFGLASPVVYETQQSVRCSDVQAAQSCSHSPWCSRSIAACNRHYPVCGASVGSCRSGMSISNPERERCRRAISLIMGCAEVFKKTDFEWACEATRFLCAVEQLAVY